MKLTLDEVLAIGNADLTARFLKEDCLGILFSAIQENNKADIEKYLNLGIDINSVYIEETPLIKAISNGNVDIIKFLLEKGADVNKGALKWSPLFHACYYNNATKLEIINLLIEKGADIHYVTSDGRNVLSVVTNNMYEDSDIEFVKLFLNKGVNVNLVINNEQNIIDYVQQCRINLVLPLLIEHGFEVTEKCIERQYGDKKIALEKYLKFYVYFGIVSNDKLEISLPEMVEKTHDTQYYYVYQLEKKNNSSSAPTIKQINIMSSLFTHYGLQEPQMFYEL